METPGDPSPGVFLYSSPRRDDEHIDSRGRGVEIIPEPATMSLLGLGTLALIRRRRQT